MKKLLSAIVMLLAINFLAVVGGVGWLFNSGKLDKAKVADIQKLVFAPPETQPTTQPVEPEKDPTTQPFLKLDELLAQKAGLPAGEQIEFIEKTFDAKMAELDRRQRELAGLNEQISEAQKKLSTDRTKLVGDQTQLSEQQDAAGKLATDKGFQDSLKLYNSLPAKNVKKIFASLDDETIVRYIRAMEPRAASKIVKEFKTPEEVNRIQKIMERMRLAQPPATTKPSPVAGAAGAGPEASTKE